MDEVGVVDPLKLCHGVRIVNVDSGSGGNNLGIEDTTSSVGDGLNKG